LTQYFKLQSGHPDNQRVGDSSPVRGLTGSNG
jgi:hypothetical protein